ncbi:MAG: methyltransferase domain-containing protein [Nitrosomonas sp.]|nr:methyltransferase domain-containing protein [Nitrosomonas sp.]
MAAIPVFYAWNRMPLQYFGSENLESGFACSCRRFLFRFKATSIDLVILPHTPEFSNNPNQILREVNRVLIPEGSLSFRS